MFKNKTLIILILNLFILCRINAQTKPLDIPLTVDTIRNVNELQRQNFNDEIINIESFCVDLVIDTAKILYISKKNIIIEYTIINKGNKPAPIFGTSMRSETDNVAVKFYYSGSNRLTKGAMLITGTFLTEPIGNADGMLLPNVPYRNKIKFSIVDRSAFNTNILIELDAFDTIPTECNEANNVFSLSPNWIKI
jgi:hypothetical protein